MIQKLKLPIFALLISLSFILLWKILDLPSDEVMIKMARGFFLKYGFITVLVAAIIESMLVVGWYLPGGIVIFSGVILASGHPYLAMMSVSATIIGCTIGYTANYFLGKYGWYKLFIKFGLSKSLSEAQVQFQKYGYQSMYMSYWQPNLAALISTCAGITHSSFSKFFFHTVVSTFFWSIFWGTSAYVLGEKILSYLGAVFFGIMIIWIGFIIFKNYFSKTNA